MGLFGSQGGTHVREANLVLKQRVPVQTSCLLLGLRSRRLAINSFLLNYGVSSWTGIDLLGVQILDSLSK